MGPSVSSNLIFSNSKWMLSPFIFDVIIDILCSNLPSWVFSFFFLSFIFYSSFLPSFELIGNFLGFHFISSILLLFFFFFYFGVCKILCSFNSYLCLKTSILILAWSTLNNIYDFISKIRTYNSISIDIYLLQKKKKD